MTREEAYEMIKMMRQFKAEYPNVKIEKLLEVAGERPQTELQIGNQYEEYTDWYAAKVIEANSIN